ncbi:MAG: TolC family protein [Planctomycetota bacterium]
MSTKLLKVLLPVTLTCLLCVAIGCQSNKQLMTSFPTDLDATPTLGDSFLKISSPADCDLDCLPEDTAHLDSISPNALADYSSISYSPISLADCIQRALADSEVFRKLGGTIVSQPGSVDTALDPALAFTDPLIGEQAALSAFDANVAASLFFENNDRPFNNQFSGDTNGLLKQDLGEYRMEINKLAATGTLFTARQTINYDNNNQAGNRFQGSAWEAIVDAGFRHPLLQGSGTMFNRIAGPSQTPGQYNGVLIARTNTEIGMAEFQESVREFIANVENAYWDLYYAYRELDAQTDARDAAYEVYKRTEALAKSQRIPGLELASAKEQYLRFEAAIIESLEGRTIDGTQANSGMTGGSFRRTVGVRVAERRLRYLVGMAITDGTLLQPNEVPSQAAIVFDWDQSVQSAVTRRPETLRQRWLLKQKELELTASRNFLKPRLDIVGNYRFRGLGKDLAGGDQPLRLDILRNEQESSALRDLGSGDFQEVQIGGEFRMPVGYRQANAAVRNAELSVQRARKVLEEQERKILLDLSNAIGEARRAHSAMDIAQRRFEAAVQYRDQAAERVSTNRAQMDVLLEAQRRILEAQLQYINAEVEYTQAIKNVHFERATYLQYHGIVLQESQSDAKAYADAQNRYSRRSSMLNYVVRDAAIGQQPGGDAEMIETDGAIVDENGMPVETLPNQMIDGMVMPPMNNATIGTSQAQPVIDPTVIENGTPRSPFVPTQQLPVDATPRGTMPNGVLPGGAIQPAQPQPRSPNGSNSALPPTRIQTSSIGPMSRTTKLADTPVVTGTSASNIGATVSFQSDATVDGLSTGSNQSTSNVSKVAKLSDNKAEKISDVPVNHSFGGPLDRRAEEATDSNSTVQPTSHLAEETSPSTGASSRRRHK